MRGVHVRAVQGGAAAGLAALAILAAGASAADWLQFAGSPGRSSIAASLPGNLTQASWVLSDDAGAPITFVGQSGIAADDERVFAIGRVGGQAHVFATDAQTGDLIWKAPIPALHFESWSMPAIDHRNAGVIIASGKYLTAFDRANGTLRWQTPLERNIVNASPLVTSDLGAANRAFITDYDGFGGSGRLYCINIDPFDPAANPFQPGEIVWSTIIGGASGNTPAYHGGIVYAASTSDTTGLSPGQVHAFPADAIEAPSPIWTVTNPLPNGFFGGVSVRAVGQDRFVYAASYALYGGQRSANLIKIDATSGELVWSIGSNRTDATPIALPDGRVVLSSGIQGYGSIPSIQLFEDHGASASLIWDSALDSWVDLNNNGVMDPGEYLVMGGWTHQPVVHLSAGSSHLLVGRIAPQTFSACTDLYLVDLDRHPMDPGFILSHFSGAGSTPAAAHGNLYTLGPGGLHAFIDEQCYANCDASTVQPILNVDDFTCFINQFALAMGLTHEQQVAHYANCDGSSTPPALNVDDLTCFINQFAAGCP